MFFHVSSVRNRESIEQHGLDCVFVCRTEWDVQFFLRINNTGTAVDVWAVDGLTEDDLVVDEGGGNFDYVPRRIARDDLTLFRRDVEMPDGRSTQW